MAQLSREEFDALNEIAKARRQLMAQTFRGTQLRFGKTAFGSPGYDLVDAANGVFGAIKDLVSGKDQATQAVSLPGVQQSVKGFLTQLADIDSFETLKQVIGGEAAAKMVADVSPIIGVVKSVYDLSNVAITVVRDARALYKSDYYAQGFRPGAPSAAAESIKIIIRRDLAMHSFDFAQQGTATGLKIAGTFVDVGTVTNAAVGVATSVANLGLKLFALGLQIKDMQAGNRWLEKPDAMSLQVFNDSPVLGSYLLVSANTSDLINMFVVDIGLTPNWKDDVERVYEKQMNPLLKLAGEHIASSPLRLEGLHSMLRAEQPHSSKKFFVDMKARVARFVHAA